MNAITAVPGIRVGHAQDYDGITGCTVILCESDAVAGVSIRGSASGVRQFSALYPSHSVPTVQAIMLAGGSAFGLDAGSGAMRYLKEQNRGYVTTAARVPIVPTAVIYDLGIGKADAFATAVMGYQACIDASTQKPVEGSVGAGTGATIGKIRGVTHATKGGVGTASLATAEGLIVGALAVVNAFGDVIEPTQQKIVAGARESPSSHRFIDSAHVICADVISPEDQNVQNTTLAVVATNARLDKLGAAKLSDFAANAFPRCLRPAHTLYDGDLVVSLSMGQIHTNIHRLGLLAEQAVITAILNAVKNATTHGGIPCHRDLFD